jgi:hypothetical protein
MAEPDTARLLKALTEMVGPAPWYWKTFPLLRSSSGQKFVWTYHGEQGPLGYLVSLALEQEPEKPRLALNTYCRPFVVTPSYLGVWCPEGTALRLVCFELDELKSFGLGEIAGWFKQSTERIYAATAPIADFDVPLGLDPGVHNIEVPRQLQAVEELIAPVSCVAKSHEDAAMALYVFYLHAGLVEVLPQRWFTRGEPSPGSNPGQQWIARAARDPDSHRIFGDGVRIGSFLLEEDGQQLDRWIEETT